MTIFLITFVFSFIFCWVALPAALGILKTINFYTAVSEGRCKVYLLFGKVLGVVEEPGLHLLWIDLGPQAALVRFFGRIYEIDRRLDQEQWGWVFGMKCECATQWIFYLRIPIPRVRFAPT